MRRIGPGILVTAAFIGPGTITTASVAGARFGFALLWALVFSIFATITLQEMAARLGLVTGAGLAEALRSFENRALSLAAIVLVVAAIALGNAAFETGNIMGAALGMEVLTGGGRSLWAVVIGIVAAACLLRGTYAVIERLLVVLVVVMSVVFVLCMVLVRPDLGDMFRGMVVPTVPEGGLITVVALIGTTVVPYNLFLHASSVREKWSSDVPVGEALAEARADTAISIGIGGVITLAVMSTAAAAFFARGTELVSAATMAGQLEPLLGAWAKVFLAFGLLAAGLSSAITAPLAAAYATGGALGWPRDLRDRRMRLVWGLILVVGTTLAALGTKPVAAILFAQAANGILLPLVAIFLLVVMNRRDLLGDYRNGFISNTIGVVVVLVAAGLGFFQLAKVIGVVEG